MTGQKREKGIQEIEKKVKNENRQKMALDIIAGLGILTVATFTPGALKGISMLQRMFKKPRDKESTYRAFQRLKEKGHLRFSVKDGRTHIEITDKGRMHLLRLGGVSSEKKQRWDGSWRMVIYDISEKRTTKRKLLHEALRNTGFYRLQDSVWVYPYPCDELVVMLKTEYQLGSEVIYAVLKHLENDKKLIEHFHLERP